MTNPIPALSKLKKETDVNVLQAKTLLLDALVKHYGKDAINGLLNQTHTIRELEK